MPANRSRTERWRESLHQIYERGGGLEFSISRGEADTQAQTAATDDLGQEPSETPECESSRPSDLVWRVRILELHDDEIIVENPVAMGQNIPVREGVELVGIIALGQNRWTFRTRVVGAKVVPVRHGPSIQAIKIEMPTTVERCVRRNFLRVGTANLNLPKVECFPLLDPTSVVPAEIANRALIHDLQASSITGRGGPTSADAILLPEVGPRFTGTLVNIGGGGVGLLIPRDEASRADRSRLLWLRIDLAPEIPAPIAVTARLVHTHIDSEQNLYAGVAFDFGFHTGHRPFVVEQITRYVNKVQAGQFVQREQLRRAG